MKNMMKTMLGAACRLTVCGSCAGLLFCVGGLSAQTVWYVDVGRADDSGDGRSWGAAKKSIQAAVDAAAANDTVLVTNGVYAPISTGNKTILIKSVNGAALSSIDGGGAYRCATLGSQQGDYSTVLQGFTLLNGDVTVSNNVPILPDRGGGVVCGTLVECVISNCVAVKNGGGARWSSLRDCLVVGNTANDGAAWGGGLSHCVAEQCSIVSNHAVRAGGGVDGGYTKRCFIYANSAEQGGGGDGLAAEFESCLIVGNIASNSGGGVFVQASGKVRNCTIYGNTARWGAGVRSGSVENSIVVGNHDPSGNEQSVSNCVPRHCCLSPFVSGSGNIAGDPLFRNPEAFDFTLSPGSPCIDAGAATVYLASRDYLGNPRIAGMMPDIGAVEYPVNAVAVLNVRAQPRWPWNGKVDIDYEVFADDLETDLWVSFSGRDLDRNLSLPVRTLEGDGADGRVRPGLRRATWDAAADAPGANAAAFAVTVSVSAEAKYLVVDLSGGPSAAAWPVSYLGDVPSGGWTDEHKTEKLVLRKIPAGTFMMGSPEGELGRRTNETRHRVTLTQPVYMGVFEVTQRQWELVTGNSPSDYKGDTRPVERVSYNMIRGTAGGAAWPVNGQVDVDSFIGRLRARTTVAFDLPTEAQWEHACRAGTSTALNSGNDLTNTVSDAGMDEVGRYGCNRSDGKGGYSQHTASGSYLPNAWGLYDMHGNVWEWCLDWHGAYPDGDASDPVGAASGTLRVLRGGHWNYNYAQNCRSAYRNGKSAPSGTGDDCGLRVVVIPVSQ